MGLLTLLNLVLHFYEKAYITSVITIVFGILDLLAAYIVKEKAEPFDSADDGRKSVYVADLYTIKHQSLI